MPRPPDYGIIYNWDGGPHSYDEVPQSMESLLERTYAPLIDTQVGALFWCIGEHAARWASENLEQLGQDHGRRYENAASFTHTENIRQMLERGEDPQQAIVERGHELGLAVYGSVRMNDNHFNGAQVSDLDSLHHTEMTRLRREHPEWLLGDRTSEWFALSWDMSVPDVREHRLAHVRETCERYDWDGVELDWQRHAFHLPDDDAWRLRYTLTDVQRAVRRLTDELAAKRGRPFYVAARVSGSLEQCRRIGYDLETWIDEGLVDILIPAGNAATDASIDVAAYRELCAGTDVVVYPGFDGGLPDPFVGPEDAQTKAKMRTRAISSRYHAAGAHGIYAFNWHADATRHRDLLTQIGSPDTLRNTSKIYAATHRFIHHEGDWRGAYHGDRLLGDVPVALRTTVTGVGPTIELTIAEAGVVDGTLRVRLQEFVVGDEVVLSWDGEQIEAPERTYCMAQDSLGISGVSSAVWLSTELSSVAPGPHTVTVTLRQRHPQVASDLVLTDVEFVVGA